MKSQWTNCRRPLLINDRNYCRVSWLAWLFSGKQLFRIGRQAVSWHLPWPFLLLGKKKKRQTSKPESWLIYVSCLWIYMLNFFYVGPLRGMRVNDTENLDWPPNGHFLSLNLVEIKQTSLPGNEPRAGLQATLSCSCIPPTHTTREQWWLCWGQPGEYTSRKFAREIKRTFQKPICCSNGRSPHS